MSKITNLGPVQNHTKNMKLSLLFATLLLLLCTGLCVLHAQKAGFENSWDEAFEANLDGLADALADSLTMSYNGDAIASEIASRYGSVGTAGGRCARAVRESIEAATGLTLRRTTSAKDYGASLLAAGFEEVYGYAENGDVAIFQNIPGHPHGHIQVKT